MVGALEGLRILECGDFVAAPYAATMLGHLGADVIKVEPPEGDSNRRRGPFPPGRESIESGGLHLYLDQAKRGVALDLDSDAGRTGLRRLAATADALIASGPPDLLERRGLTYTALSDANPALVVTTVTPLGLHAATARSQPMRELCDLAVGGWLSISPGALSEPDRPPLKPFGQQAHFQAGIHAAIATLGAIAVRRRTGAGQHVDISVQAVIASNLENGLMHYTYGNRVASRLGQRLLGPWGIIRLADGLLFLICVTDDEWGRMVEFMGHPEWADSPLFADRGARTENNDGLLALIEGELADRPVYETYTAMQARRIPCTPVNDMDGLLRNPHLRERQYWVAGEHPDAGEWTYPGAQWQFERTPWQQGRRAPRLGEHTAEALSGAPVADQSRRGEPRPVATPRVGAPTTPDGPLPLAGVRVIEFTWVWAGPACGLHLAHLGAESIKIESVTRADTVRSLGPFWEDVRGPNRSGYYNQYNQGKRSLTLNLKHPRGLDLARDLVRRADVVVDNFSAGALERMGLGPATLRAIKPDLVQISMAGHGQTGPIAPYVAYGPTQVPMIGLASLTGYPGDVPREVGISYGDPNGGLHAALAVLAALHHRDRTGEGQYIDMSQWEAALPLVCEGLLTYQMAGAQPPRMGNRDQFEAPQGVFRCAGDDAWVALSCWSDAEWRALAAAIDRADLRDDPTLATAAGRKEREEEIEAAIEAWTAQRTKAAAAGVLQSAGVPAAPVFTTADVTHSPDLAARDYWVELPHPEVGARRHAGIPWRFSGTPLRVRGPAPTMGQHTDAVLRETLGLPDAAIAALRAEGALD